MQEEVTATIQAVFRRPADAALTEQGSMIHADLCRLLDADSTTGVECITVTIAHLAPEAETYGNTEARHTAERQSDGMGDALSNLYDECEGDAQSLLQNALSDLRHFADQHGLAFGLADKSAFQIYRAEKDAEDRNSGT